LCIASAIPPIFRKLKKLDFGPVEMPLNYGGLAVSLKKIDQNVCILLKKIKKNTEPKRNKKKKKKRKKENEKKEKKKENKKKKKR